MGDVFDQQHRHHGLPAQNFEELVSLLHVVIQSY
jgi:hypothetical protein